MTDVGKSLFCRVTATNAAGSASADSNTVGPVAAAGGGTSTWNPADLFETATGALDLSDGNNTATGRFISGFPQCHVRGTLANSSGKKYFEITIGQMPSNAAVIGLCDGVHTFTTTTAPGIDDATGIVWNFAAFTSPAFNASGGIYTIAVPPTPAIGSVFGFAVDFDAAGGTVWFRHNGTWLRGDPVAGTDGCAWGAGPADAMFPYLGTLSTTDPDFTATLNTGGSAFANALPASWSAWG